MTGILVDAVRHARHAPSIFNTQPWQWRIGSAGAELWPDSQRWLEHTDPQGRMLLLSCGAAAHHAAVTVGAQGWHVAVDHFPDGPEGPFARLRLRAPGRPHRTNPVRRRGTGLTEWLRAGYWLGPYQTITGHNGKTGTASWLRAGWWQDSDQATSIGPGPEQLAAAIGRRRSDRRAFNARPLSNQTLAALRRAVAGQGVALHFVRRDEVALLAALTARAAEDAAQHPWQAAELKQWTHRPVGAGDGVPATTAVSQGPRRVPIRDFAPASHLRGNERAEWRYSSERGVPPTTHNQPGSANRGRGEQREDFPLRGSFAEDGDCGRDGEPTGIAELESGPGSDAGATYAVLCGPGERPVDWLRAGEALSALLLTATAGGVSSSMMSEVIESPRTRRMLRALVGGLHPYLLVRLGYPQDACAPPPAPRRRPEEHLTSA